MRGFRTQVPQECPVGAWDWRRDVRRGVFQAHGVDFCFRGYAEETGAEGQNAATVCGRAFGEYGDAAVRVRGDEVGDGY